MYGIIINAPYSVLIFLMIRLLLIINRKRVKSEIIIKRSLIIFVAEQNMLTAVSLKIFSSSTAHKIIKISCEFNQSIIINDDDGRY